MYARGLGIFLNFNGINKWNTVIIWTIEFFFLPNFWYVKKIFFETKFFELIATSFQFHPSLSRIDETKCLEKSYYYYFFFSFPDLYRIHISCQLREFSFIIRLNQRQIKMTFKFHSIMAMTLLYIPPVYIVDHYYIVLSLRIFTNIRNILCNLFSVVNLNDEISFRFRKTSFKKVEKKRIFPQTGIRCLFTNFSTIYSHYLL